MNSKLLVILSIVILQASNGMQQPPQSPAPFLKNEYQLPYRQTLTRLLQRNGYQKIVNYHFPVTEWSGEKVTCGDLALKLHHYRFLFVPPADENDTESFALHYAPKLMDVLLSEYPEASADIDAYVADRKQYFDQERAQKLVEANIKQ